MSFARVWPLPDRQRLIRCRLDRDLLGLDCHFTGLLTANLRLWPRRAPAVFLGSRRRQAGAKPGTVDDHRVSDDFGVDFPLHLLSNLSVGRNLGGLHLRFAGDLRPAAPRREGPTRSPVQDAGLPDLAGGIGDLFGRHLLELKRRCQVDDGRLVCHRPASLLLVWDSPLHLG